MLPRRIGLTGLLVALAGNVLGAQVVLTPTHYDVSFAVDYEAEVLRGTARIVVQNPSMAPVREASLLLYRLFRVRSVRDDRGNVLVRATATIDLGQLNNDWIFTTAWTERVAQSATIDELAAYYRRR